MPHYLKCRFGARAVRGRARSNASTPIFLPLSEGTAVSALSVQTRARNCHIRSFPPALSRGEAHAGIQILPNREDSQSWIRLGVGASHCGAALVAFAQMKPWGPGANTGARRAGLERLDKLLEIAFLVSGTNIRFGVEAILRLVPGIGDIAASALSCGVLYEAHRLGVPPHLIRMIGNVLVEEMAGTVPLAGDLFDVGWRANRRNVRLLREYFEPEGLR
jgi:hypothetical protein